MDFSKIPANVLYGAACAAHRRRGDDFENLLQMNSHYWMGSVYSHFGGKSPPWGPLGGYFYEAGDLEALEKARDFMREFFGLTASEIESALVSKSVTEAAKYSVKVKMGRFIPEVEKLFFDRCRGKKSRLSALMSYCTAWSIIPENMTEVTLVAGFEDSRRGHLSKEFIKALAENKRKCKELLAQIMEIEGISESEPITTILEKLE